MIRTTTKFQYTQVSAAIGCSASTIESFINSNILNVDRYRPFTTAITFKLKDEQRIVDK